jgi:putative pyruvate formate lyase activating enzyme
MLRSCTLCERRCGVNRLAGERAPCGLKDETWCFKRHISYAEEGDLLPSYMVYLGACNLRCRFCVQGPGCFAPAEGCRVDAREAARDFARVVDRGARTINLLGGEPSLHLHTILEIAAASDRALPLVLNTNMYMSPEVIDLLEGVVTLYLADFKFGDNGCAKSLAGIERYVEVVRRNLLHASRTTPLIVRHLLMPGHFDCCLRPVVDWLASELPGTPLSLMTSYVPAWRAASDEGPMSRCLTDEERRRAEAYAASSGLRRCT